MKLYTRTGDDGGTALFDGRRVRKDDPRVAAYGEVDELNAHIGAAVALLRDRIGDWAALCDRLTAIQHELFTLGAELATPHDAPNRHRIPVTSAEQAARLERWIDEAVAPVAPLREFVLPGGDSAAAQLHVCRTVCRRAERAIVALAGAGQVSPQVLVYINRLSDLLFAWARLANHLSGVADVPWRNPRD